MSLKDILNKNSREFMASSMIPNWCTNIISNKINIDDFVIIGSWCVISPGANIKERVNYMALNLVSKDLEPWSINVRISAREIKNRSRKFLQLRDTFIRN